MNQIDLWRDGRTAYIDIFDDDGKPAVFSYNLKDDGHSPHGYRYGPYMKVFTGYADRQGEWADFYMEDASHYTATNSKDMKYTVHAQVGFPNTRTFLRATFLNGIWKPWKNLYCGRDTQPAGSLVQGIMNGDLSVDNDSQANWINENCAERQNLIELEFYKAGFQIAAC